MWVRVDVDKDSLIDATLLNTPYQDFGVEEETLLKYFRTNLKVLINGLLSVI